MREFLYSMSLKPEALRGKLLLDSGCGHGMLTAAIASEYGLETAGLDFSGAVSRAQATLVHLVAAIRGERPMLADCTRRDRAISLFDNYSPPYQFRYHARELRQFFAEAGMDAIQDTTLANEARQAVAFVGVKTASEHFAPEQAEVLLRVPVVA